MKTRATQAALSRILGCSESAISRCKKTLGFPTTDDDNEFEIHAVVIWWYLHKSGGEMPDPMLGDCDSEGLERYRMARAQREEIKLEADRNNTVDAEVVRSMLQEQAAVVRSSLEKLERQFGAEALEIVLEALDEVGIESEVSPC